MLREHQLECAHQVCFRALAPAKLLAASQAPAAMPGKQRSRRQFRDAGIERRIAGVVDEIAGFDGVEFHPAPLADQKVLLKARHQVGNESSQGVALRILAGLVVVDASRIRIRGAGCAMVLLKCNPWRRNAPCRYAPGTSGRMCAPGMLSRPGACETPCRPPGSGPNAGQGAFRCAAL